MRRFRYRLRTLLLAVVGASLLFGSVRERWQERAAYHRAMETHHRNIDGAARDSEMRQRTAIEYNSKMRLWYEQPSWSFRCPEPQSCFHPLL